ncbi:MAG: carotenoid oxygenase family protein [Gammaproteobacteria bacterium]|nr:carotenoid oxygenase family protein [Gammaproteobacteria bacterium]
MTNPSLEGNYAPVTEEISRYDLPVDGAIPMQLNGRYLRTGPNPIGIPDRYNHHWSAGHGMVHGVELADGKAVWYKNRWVMSPEISRLRESEPVPAPTSPTAFDGSGNTNVFEHAGRIYAVNELSLPYELNPSLDTVKREDFGGPLPAGMIAHPKWDKVSGEMHTIAYHFEPPYLRYHVVDADGVLVRTQEIDVAGPVMVHDFVITHTHVVFFDLPVVFNMEAAMGGHQLTYVWDELYTPRVGFKSRHDDSPVTWCEVDACYVFHPLNAFDDGHHIVIDFVRHPSMFRECVVGPREGTPQLYRWVINTRTGRVVEDCLDERGQEFPRADDRLTGAEHRFGYAISANGENDDGYGGRHVLKHDLTKGTTREHDFGPGHHASEMVFIPENAKAGEDEGWLMGFVFDRQSNTSSLVILDASGSRPTAVAVIALPRRVPYGFHGNWIPDSALRSRR